MTYAGKSVTREQVQATIRFLGRVKANRPAGGAQRLDQLVNTAINRKAGIPDHAGRKQDPEYQMRLRRDCRKVNDYFGKRISLRLCNLDTTEIRQRFAGIIPRDYRDDG